MRDFFYQQLVNTGQTAACNRVHGAEERLARWLLITSDAVQSRSFRLTHQFLSIMLGTRRSTVTIAAGKFQNAGLITYRRGVIEITDAKGLLDISCECYSVMKNGRSRNNGNGHSVR